MPTDVVLVVVGDSAQRPHFVQLAAQPGLASRVFFLGALKDVSPAYRASDILVHPTLEDTFAMVVLEAAGSQPSGSCERGKVLRYCRTSQFWH